MEGEVDAHERLLLRRPTGELQYPTNEHSLLALRRDDRPQLAKLCSSFTRINGQTPDCNQETGQQKVLPWHMLQPFMVFNGYLRRRLGTSSWDKENKINEKSPSREDG